MRLKWMLSESMRRRGISVGEVSYKGHRFPAEIIAHCVWLYHRFPLSFCEVEELMLVCGVIVSYVLSLLGFHAPACCTCAIALAA